MHGLKTTFENFNMKILKSGYSDSAHKISAYQVVLLFIWWCETTEGFISSHFDVKNLNVFSVVDYINTLWSCASTIKPFDV